jgi:hypothetical protein
MFVDGQLILEERYKVLKKLGGGAFGEIYKSKYFNTFYYDDLKSNTIFLLISRKTQDKGDFSSESCKLQ